jgi:hypothetical protein
MKWDFRHHLLMQIEMLRGDISHEELSTRLGDVTERCLARYIAGKSLLTEDEFKAIAEALSMEAHSFAGAWAASLGLPISDKGAVSWIVNRARNQWRQYHGSLIVPSRPTPLRWL